MLWGKNRGKWKRPAVEPRTPGLCSTYRELWGLVVVRLCGHESAMFCILLSCYDHNVNITVANYCEHDAGMRLCEFTFTIISSLPCSTTVRDVECTEVLTKRKNDYLTLVAINFVYPTKTQVQYIHIYIYIYKIQNAKKCRDGMPKSMQNAAATVNMQDKGVCHF